MRTIIIIESSLVMSKLWLANFYGNLRNKLDLTYDDDGIFKPECETADGRKIIFAKEWSARLKRYIETLNVEAVLLSDNLSAARSGLFLYKEHLYCLKWNVKVVDISFTQALHEECSAIMKFDDFAVSEKVRDWTRKPFDFTVEEDPEYPRYLAPL